jgi:hypothetical protein
MEMGALRRKAREAGVAEEDLDDLEDEGDPRAALVGRLASRLPAGGPGAAGAAAEVELRAARRCGPRAVKRPSLFHRERSFFVAFVRARKALKGLFGCFRRWQRAED